MKPPAITIAIPFYSGQALLRKAIASVLRQPISDLELIVCDDHGSEDGVPELLESFHDPRIKYFRNDVNLGMAGNWNRCLDLARADLVTLLHADDELLEGYCPLMLALAAAHCEPAAFFCLARTVDEQGQSAFSFADYTKSFLMPRGRKPILLHGEKSLAGLLRGDFIMCPTMCYRKSILGPRRFPTRWKMVLDLDFFAGLLLDGNSIMGLRKVLYAYRRHGHNASSGYTKSLLRFQEEVAVYDALADRSWRRGWRDAGRAARAKNIVKLHLGYRVVQDLRHLELRRAYQELAFLARMWADS